MTLFHRDYTSESGVMDKLLVVGEGIRNLIVIVYEETSPWSLE